MIDTAADLAAMLNTLRYDPYTDSQDWSHPAISQSTLEWWDELVSENVMDFQGFPTIDGRIVFQKAEGQWVVGDEKHRSAIDRYAITADEYLGSERIKEQESQRNDRD
jgi:hypothetical protein